MTEEAREPWSPEQLALLKAAGMAHLRRLTRLRRLTADPDVQKLILRRQVARFTAAGAAAAEDEPPA